MTQPEERHGGSYGAVFRLGAQSCQRRNLIEPLQARNVVMIAHRDRIKADIIGDPDCSISVGINDAPGLSMDT